MTMPWRSLLLVLILWCAGLGAAMQFAKMSLIFPALEAHYGGQGSPVLGFLVSIISLLGIGLGLVAGLIVAQRGFRPILISSLLLGAAMSAWQGFLPGLWLMLVLRLVEGVSHLAIVVAAPTLIARITPPRGLAFAMTLWSTFFGVAFALTAWLGTPLVTGFGHQSIFWVHSGMMLALAGVLWSVLPKGDAPAAPAEPLPHLRDLLAQHIEVYRDPARSAPAYAWLFYTLTFVSLLTVLPPFIPAEHRVLVGGLMPLASILVSLTLGVVLLRVMSAVSVVVLGFGLSIACAAALVVWPGNPVLCVAILGTLGLVQGANFAAVPELNRSNAARAHANGALAQTGNLGNTFGTPIALAMIAMLGFGGLMVFCICAYLCGIAVHLILARQRRMSPRE